MHNTDRTVTPLNMNFLYKGFHCYEDKTNLGFAFGFKVSLKFEKFCHFH